MSHEKRVRKAVVKRIYNTNSRGQKVEHSNELECGHTVSCKNLQPGKLDRVCPVCTVKS